MRLRLADARVVFPDSGIAPERGDLVIDGDCVAAFHPEGAGAPADCETVDLDGRWILPAFCDSHMHLHYSAQKRGMVNLARDVDRDALAAELRAAPRAGDDWVVGAGWEEPLIAQLGADVPGTLRGMEERRPVFIWSADHHRALVNDVAARHLECRAGVLVERAAERAWRRVPPRPPDLDAELEHLFSLGIGAVTSFDGSGYHDHFRALGEAERLSMRVAHSMSWEQVRAEGAPPESERARTRYRLGWVKLFLDGTLGSRTAWLFEPYDDDPGNCGVERVAEDDLEEGLAAVAASGLGIAIHAIGDRAVDVAVDVIVRLRELRGPRVDRIEHAELMTGATIERVRALEIPLSVQPCHLLEDMKIAGARWGDRCRGLLPLRRLLDDGISLAFGTDHPIETPDPWVNLRAACDRRGRDGEPRDGWFGDERIAFAEALRCATSAAASVNLLPEGWGTLRPGTPADLQIIHCEAIDAVTNAADRRLDTLLIDGAVVWGELP